MKIRSKPSLLILGLCTVALVCFSACTVLNEGGSGNPRGLSPGPTQTLPPGKDVVIQVNEKDPIYQTVTVIFAGGEGQIAVTDITMVYNRPDGSSDQEKLPPVKGSEVVFQGTRETDRIQGYVTLNTGSRYKVIDQAVPYRTRG